MDDQNGLVTDPDVLAPIDLILQNSSENMFSDSNKPKLRRILDGSPSGSNLVTNNVSSSDIFDDE